jgi:hypothetical protein
VRKQAPEGGGWPPSLGPNKSGLESNPRVPPTPRPRAESVSARICGWLCDPVATGGILRQRMSGWRGIAPWISRSDSVALLGPLECLVGMLSVRDQACLLGMRCGARPLDAVFGSWAWVWAWVLISPAAGAGVDGTTLPTPVRRGRVWHFDSGAEAGHRLVDLPQGDAARRSFWACAAVSVLTWRAGGTDLICLAGQEGRPGTRAPDCCSP